jgi:radical SAM superfamily enzyme YgiQ (UPF0313 family)
MKPALKLRCILINPWVYDFSAHSLWSRPLGLLEVAGFMSRFNVDLRLVDCTGEFRQRRFGTGKYPFEPAEKPRALRDVPRRYKRFGMGREEFKGRLRALPFPDVIFVTSLMTYWYPGVVEAVETVKALAPRVPVVLGGIYATLHSEHALRHTGADFIHRGPAGNGLRAALRTFGFRLRQRRPPLPYHRLGLYEKYPFAPVLTSTGCPFGCPYCASALLSDGFRQRDPGEVAAQIRELYGMGVRDFAFYDDALLVDSEGHIKEILRDIAPFVPGARFHCPNGLHAALLDGGLARLMRLAGFRTIRLSLETVSPDRQRACGGKVTGEDVARAVGHLKRNGFGKEHIGVYLMYGLPGQPLEEVKEGVEFIKALGVMVKLTEFSPIPGTPCWQELKESGVITEGMDPLLTNNSVFSLLYSGYDPAELDALKLEVKAYNSS